MPTWAGLVSSRVALPVPDDVAVGVEVVEKMDIRSSKATGGGCGWDAVVGGSEVGTSAEVGVRR